MLEAEVKSELKKSKVMVFEREKRDVTEFGYPHRSRTECKKQYEIKLNGQIMVEVNEF